MPTVTLSPAPTSDNGLASALAFGFLLDDFFGPTLDMASQAAHLLPTEIPQECGDPGQLSGQGVAKLSVVRAHIGLVMDAATGP